MKVKVSLKRNPNDDDSETRVLTFQAADYQDAYDRAVDQLLEGWVIVRVEILDPRANG